MVSIYNSRIRLPSGLVNGVMRFTHIFHCNWISLLSHSFLCNGWSTAKTKYNSHFTLHDWLLECAYSCKIVFMKRLVQFFLFWHGTCGFIYHNRVLKIAQINKQNFRVLSWIRDQPTKKARKQLKSCGDFLYLQICKWTMTKLGNQCPLVYMQVL